MRNGEQARRLADHCAPIRQHEAVALGVEPSRDRACWDVFVVLRRPRIRAPGCRTLSSCLLRDSHFWPARREWKRGPGGQKTITTGQRRNNKEQRCPKKQKPPTPLTTMSGCSGRCHKLSGPPSATIEDTRARSFPRRLADLVGGVGRPLDVPGVALVPLVEGRERLNGSASANRRASRSGSKSEARLACPPIAPAASAARRPPTKRCLPQHRPRNRPTSACWPRPASLWPSPAARRPATP